MGNGEPAVSNMGCGAARAFVLCVGLAGAGDAHAQTADTRASFIARAQVWAPTDVASMDLKRGPRGSGAVTPGTTVRCDYVDPAVVERKMRGRELASGGHAGWSWLELDLTNEEAGGATRAQRDALKLLAVFIQHTDTKPGQQRLVCLDKDNPSPGVPCARPFMMINDLGLTFGRANLANTNHR